MTTSILPGARKPWIVRALAALALLAAFGASAEAGTIALAWDASPGSNIAGYTLYYGTASGVYTNNVNVGNVTTWTQTGLSTGQRYYFAVTAYDTAGTPSPLSAEVNGVVAASDVTVTSAHAGTFSQGQVGATYTLTVSNVGTASTSGVVTVADTLPAGMTATAMSGSGWSCTVSTRTCTTGTALAAGASYPAITLTVTVASTAAASLTNTVTVSGGGETNTGNDTALDVTTVARAVSSVTVTPATANLVTGQAQQFVALAYDSTNAPIAGVAFTWTTTDATIAPLSTATGATTTVTPTATGAATVRATATSSGIFAQTAVSVSAPPAVTRVIVTPSTLALSLGWHGTLSAQAYDASNNLVPTGSFTWTSSAASVAKLVNTTGSSLDMIGYGVGVATITATETASGRTATASVTVTAADTLVWDTFTDTNGTALGSHVPDANLTTSAWSATGAQAPVVQSGLARVTTTGTASSRVYATIEAATADVRLATNWSVRSATAWGGIALRWSDASNFLFAGYSANELAVYRVQGGIWTRLVGAPVTATSGTVHPLEVSASAAAIQVYWDGILLLQTADTFNQSVSRHGVAWANGVDTLSGYDTFRLTGTVAPLPLPTPAPSSPPPAPSPSPSPSPSPDPSPSTSPDVSSSSDVPASPASEPLALAPSGLTATVSGATVVLHWTTPTVFPATSYVIEAGSVSGATNQANSNIGNYTSYTASPVPPGIYFVRIRAFGNGALSAASNEIIVRVGQSTTQCFGAAQPAAGLAFAVNGSNVTLWWSQGGGAAPSSYVIEAGSFPGGSNLANFDTLSTATSYFAPGVGSGTYFVRVRAKNACGVSNGSNEIVVRVGG